VVALLATVDDDMSMVIVGRTKITLVPPKNDWLVGRVEEEGEVMPNLGILIVIVRYALVDPGSAAPRKASLRIDTTVFGMFIDTNFLHNAKALLPKDTTLSGIVIDVTFLQPSKA
jgi:hypothetical protein